MNRIKVLGSSQPDFVAGYNCGELHLQNLVFVRGLRYVIDSARTQIPFMKSRNEYQNVFGAGQIEAFEDFFDRHTKNQVFQ